MGSSRSAGTRVFVHAWGAFFPEWQRFLFPPPKKDEGKGDHEPCRANRGGRLVSAARSRADLPFTGTDIHSSRALHCDIKRAPFRLRHYFKAGTLSQSIEYPFAKFLRIRSTFDTYKNKCYIFVVQRGGDGDKKQKFERDDSDH